MATTIQYRGYTFSVVSNRMGWQLFIYAPDSSARFMDLDTRDPKGLDDILAEGRRAVDDLLDR
ncbi:MAG TPA: hypothetical protein VE999_02310 [Gemmataceae bacterium]|nr:hypothetical protein [Gemmataceae bacterium]